MQRKPAGSLFVLMLTLLCLTIAVNAWGIALPVSSYDHHTDAWFDKANPDGTLIQPYSNYTPGTNDYEWKDINPSFHIIQGLGIFSYWYEAKDAADTKHYVMNDFVGRTIDLGGTLDNWYMWTGGGHTWYVQIFGDGRTNVFEDRVQVFNSGIVGAYKFDSSPLLETEHTMFELEIPYDISPQERDKIWFGDPDNNGNYLVSTPEPSTFLLLGFGVAAFIYAGAKRNSRKSKRTIS